MRIILPKLFRPMPGDRHGFLMVDLVAALAIFAIAVMPLAYAFARERQILKIDYLRAVANEVVDGEMEILTAGAGRDFPDGSQVYTVNSRAAASLPPGHFLLNRNGNYLRLSWIPDERRGLSPVVRETMMP